MYSEEALRQLMKLTFFKSSYISAAFKNVRAKHVTINICYATISQQTIVYLCEAPFNLNYVITPNGSVM